MHQFEPNAEGLSIPNAQLLGQAALTAYQDADACKKWAADNGFNEAFDFFSNVSPETDTNGFVAQSAQAVLVAFRGTDPQKPIDWFIDFDALQQRDGISEARVHQGFADALKSVWGSGQDILPQRLAGRGARAVWIAGHSLGGALAELAAAKAAMVSGIPVQGVYTFGQPRVGDEGFARKMHDTLGSRVFRFINNHDIVPRVPLWGMGFRHYADEYFFQGMTIQDDMISIESWREAIRLAALAVDLQPMQEIFALAKAILTLNANAARRELEMLGDVRQALRAGTAGIQDHSMVTGYLPRLQGLKNPFSSAQAATQ